MDASRAGAIARPFSALWPAALAVQAASTTASCAGSHGCLSSCVGVCAVSGHGCVRLGCYGAA
eukprot:502950-Lingulodinium_polyedra.AAC.1